MCGRCRFVWRRVYKHKRRVGYSISPNHRIRQDRKVVARGCHAQRNRCLSRSVTGREEDGACVVSVLLFRYANKHVGHAKPQGARRPCLTVGCHRYFHELAAAASG